MRKTIEEQIEEHKEKGISLLKKGRTGIVRMLFGRTGLILLLLLAQAAVLFGAFWKFSEFLPHYYGVTAVFTLVMIVVLLNARHDPTSKITWLIIITLVPMFGGLLYLFTMSDLGHRALKKRMNEIISGSRSRCRQEENVFQELEHFDPGAAGLASYLRRIGNFPVYHHTSTDYFPLGEDKFHAMLETLKKAKSFIFLEYFIVDEGSMWGQVLEILIQKAGEGVDVRLMYDGTCEFSRLPRSYPEKLQKLGIKCQVFAPLRPFLSTHYNYRDHRKILVIDGHTAFTGGVNLADEYINEKPRFGHWKDTAVEIRGDAVRSFTLMFLQMWGLPHKNTDYDRFLSAPTLGDPHAPGYVIPYGDCPLDNERVGQQVYMDLLNRARRYVHIMTPYLILDGEMENALKYAAARGVDVELILPGIPDKKAPYALAKTHYPSLMESGVKIFEYTPGFVHAKEFVCDDREAVVGTINLDYRSLYHHFECAVYMYRTGCIRDIEADFRDTRSRCRRVTRETCRNEKKTTKLIGHALKGIAPLL